MYGINTKFKFTQFFMLTLAGGLVAGCATTYQPVVDIKGVDPMAYQRDLDDCQTYATQIDPAANAVRGGVGGAAFGALLGAVVGAALGADTGQWAAVGAAQGGVTGAGYGAAGGVQTQMSIIKNCMAGRGYKVLG